MRRRVDAAEVDPLAERLALCSDGALTIKAAVRFSGLSRSVLYERMRAGDLRVVRVGRRVLIPKSQLVRLLANHLD